MFFKKKKIKIGIVVEYNPFHNGHIHQINKIKEKFPNSQIIVAMSHKYSQRGEIIVASWRERVKIAKKYGVNKFIKLKTKISSQAAHIFASEAVKKLAKKGIQYLFFGSETDDILVFEKIAHITKYQAKEYNFLVKTFLKYKGNSFPKATNLALQELSGLDISLPNDILGVEYVKYIVHNNLNIKPVCIKRTIDFHSDKTFTTFASASKIRSMIKNGEDYTKFTPMLINKPKLIEDTYPVFQNKVKKLSVQKLQKIKMISEGIENLFKKHIDKETYDEFIEACVSKRYTRSRIQRTYLFVLLGVKK